MPSALATIARRATAAATEDPTAPIDVTKVLDARGDAVRLADFNADGRADLVVYAVTSGRWAAAFNDVAGLTFRAGQWDPAWQVAAANGDGRDDVFAYNPTSGQWLTALNVSPGRFAVTSSVWTPGWAVATGDVNGDGRGDVVLYDPVTGVWFQSVTVGPGVFAYASGNWLPGASLVGRPR